MKQSLFYVFLILLMTSCFDAPENIDMKMLHGEWSGAAWEIEGGDNRDASNVGFLFNVDSTYTATAGSGGETGIYRIDGDKLYTTAKGAAEKNVRILKVNTDSLIFEMNRVGTIETLILVKKQ